MIVFTQSVDGVDWRFLQVKVDVLWHGERLVLSILSSTEHTHRGTVQNWRADVKVLSFIMKMASSYQRDIVSVIKMSHI